VRWVLASGGAVALEAKLGASDAGATRTHVLGHAEFVLPSLEQVIAQTIALGRLTNPAIRCVGISLNTAKLDAAAAQREFDRVEQRLTLPVADPMRGGPAFERLLDACMS